MSRICIDDILDLNMKEFMVFMEDMNFQETKNMKVLLEIEYERTQLLYSKYKESNNPEKMTKMNINAVIISERIGICEYYLTKRGVDLSIFK